MEKYEQLIRKDSVTYEKQYSDENFLKKISKCFKNIGVKGVLMAYVIWFFLKSDTSSTLDKLQFIFVKCGWLGVFALGYFVSPVDAVPDVIPVVGFLDDVAIIAYVAHKLMTKLVDINPNLTIDILTKAREETTKLFPNSMNEIDNILKEEFGYEQD